MGYRVDPELSPNRPVAQAAVVEPSQQVYVPIQQGRAAVQPQAQQGGAAVQPQAQQGM